MNSIYVKKYPGLRAFIQHGFEPQGESGNQVYGRCPFCGKDKHFYINPEIKAWDCKSRCGKSGGFQTFLDEAFALSQEYDNSSQLQELSEERGLSLETLEYFEVGYNHTIESYIIPVKNLTHDKVWDLRIYKDKKMLSTSGCQVGLLNWWELQKDSGIVYICEGEWDGMALHEAFQKASITEALVAVPGAGTFKSDWLMSFQGKDARVLYDNDEAGQAGSVKVFNLLQSIVKDIKLLHWPDGTPDGFDIRDHYKKSGAKKLIKFIEDNLRPDPPGAANANVRVKTPKQAVATAVAKLEGPGLSAEEVYAAYRKWLHLPNTLVLDFMFGTVLANRLPGDPLWGQLVGPSGATKTELLQSLNDAPMIATATSLTPHALISGANFSGAGDPSLLPKWNGKVVIIKDLTVLLSMNQIHREEIFSIFRDAYDGRTEKHFGNGVIRTYNCRFGMLAGVTPIIEIYAEEHTALGERFLRFPIEVPETMQGKIDLARRAMGNTLHEDVMRAELKATATSALTYQFNEEVEIPDSINERVLHIAQLLALMRSTIKRDHFTKDIQYKPFSEMATRLSKQFRKLLLGVSMFRRLKVVDEKAYDVVKHCVIGTIPSRMNEITRKLYLKNPKGHYSLDQVATLVRLPTQTVQRILDGLTILDILERKTYTSGVRPEWSLTKEALELIETTQLYERKPSGKATRKSDT